MAQVRFELTHDFDVPVRVVWAELVDWTSHERWVPSTSVELHSDDPTVVGAEFTAWSGPMPSTALGRRLSLEDRMRVDECEFDEVTSTGRCTVTKLGPTLSGWATITASPHGTGSQVGWLEDIVVPYVPQFLAPVVGRIAEGAFRFSVKRLAKQLGSHSVDAQSRVQANVG